MSLFSKDPYECDNVDELREWVQNLQNLLFAQRQTNQVLREQNVLLYSVCEKQEELNSTLKERGQLLKERIAQHETGAIHSHRMRLN